MSSLSVLDVASTLWNYSQSIVGVRSHAPTSEKVLRVYNGVVAAAVFAGLLYKTAKVENTLMSVFIEWEYFTDIGVHALHSQISKDSPVLLKVVAVGLDVFRLNLIKAYQYTPPPVSEIPKLLNQVDIGNHFLNIAYQVKSLFY